ncbi:DNA cytosine methyltransferase [Mesorhizobium sp. CA6]|uniref:DNA cytosine methyltransferase n=1 Tax=Mesorhizobium sp. CA6 TaxID=588500 RepID=UPI001CCC0D78|nr:DNA cytosine methyltransferase [Mesorhizobium sp. CA6]MBZ9770351.1 DNA cytosine methyltransferase [Mesorhizobium sp. CA6]
MPSNDIILADLFCGCSGLGLGARQAGFAVGASVDTDPILTSSHATNFPNGKLRLGDIADLTGNDLKSMIGKSIDGIVGGPPCQGFSEIGRSNPDDPRRLLLYHFFRVVAEARPRFFLMENVRGLANRKNRPFLESALQQVADQYEIVGPIMVDGSEFGAATRRPRIFVVGYDKRYVDNFNETDLLAERCLPATVADAIGDLHHAIAISGADGFDVWELPETTDRSAYARALASNDGKTTGHRRTIHRVEIAERFASVLQGEMDEIGRHPRLAWGGQCPTIRAGTGPDKGSRQAVRPLHPDEPRVITVREAARLQGFPDWFKFHPTVWHSFRMIGNSVSPIVAQRLFSAVRKKLSVGASLQAAE